MKKIFLMLLLVLCLSLTACKGDDCEHSWRQTSEDDQYLILTCDKCGEEKKEEKVIVDEPGLTKQEWENAASEHNYHNYTLVYSASLIQGGEVVQINTYKITENLVSSSFVYEGELVVDNQVLSPEESIDQRNLYIKFFTTYLANYEDFVYDEANDQYTNSKPVTITYSMTTHDTSTTFTIKNGVIKFNENNQLASLYCEFTQSITTPNGPVSLDCYTTFELSNYGTTVVE